MGISWKPATEFSTAIGFDRAEISCGLVCFSLSHPRFKDLFLLIISSESYVIIKESKSMTCKQKYMRLCSVRKTRQGNNVSWEGMEERKLKWDLKISRIFVENIFAFQNCTEVFFTLTSLRTRSFSVDSLFQTQRERSTFLAHKKKINHIENLLTPLWTRGYKVKLIIN